MLVLKLYLSNITNRILLLVAERKSRPLEKTYSFVFMYASHYKVREDKQIVIKAAYVIIGVNLEK
ncbi:MAG: transposase [Clostridium sp.]|uniref:transposase n=1 Tax=Clostridium sp. TaxID=1506 RepID=UPI00399A10FF